MNLNIKTDKETFLGLKTQDNKAYEILYKFYYPSVKNFILKNSGTSADAEDVFQETILVLLEKIPKEEFTLTSSLKTYIFAISSNLWLKKLRSSNRIVKTELTIYAKYLHDYEEAENEIQKQNSKRAQSIFSRLTSKCKHLLKAIFFDEKNIELVTKEFGYTNKHTAQNQKYKCLEQARKA